MIPAYDIRTDKWEIAQDAMSKVNNKRAEISKLGNSTYIDPSAYNYVFADTDLASMNFWVQMGVEMKSRRVMSAKMIPNL